MAVDWKRVKEEYMTTDVTLDELAEKFKVSKSTLYKKSSAGKWVQAKKKVGKKVEEKFIEKASSMKATQEVNKLERLIKAADRMSGVIEEAMNDPKQFRRYVVQKKVRKENGSEKMEAEEKVFDKFDAKAMRDMTATMKELAALIRSLNNIPEGNQEEGNHIIVSFEKMEEYM